jgi:hypothetical protein
VLWICPRNGVWVMETPKPDPTALPPQLSKLLLQRARVPSQAGVRLCGEHSPSTSEKKRKVRKRVISSEGDTVSVVTALAVHC